MKEQRFIVFSSLSEETRKSFCNPEHPYGFAAKLIGNRDPLYRIGRILYGMLECENHCCNDCSVSQHPIRNIAFIGSPGTGKTTFARTIADAIDIPLVEIQPQTIQCVNDILTTIASVCENTALEDDTLELREVGGDGCGSKKFILPPMVVFIDEVHLLRDRLVDALLKATESNDRIMVTEKGWTADCRHVFWIIATTERGKLGKAFDTRFNKIYLKPYSRKEIAQIVNLKYPMWSMETCELIVKYGGKIPREVIPFAEDVSLALKMDGLTLPETIKQVARQYGIDEYGMSCQQLNIIKALGKEPVAKNRLCYVAGVEPEELQEFIMPPLLTGTEDDPPLVSIDSRGYVITDAGRKELNKRNLSHSQY